MGKEVQFRIEVHSGMRVATMNRAIQIFPFFFAVFSFACDGTSGQSVGTPSQSSASSRSSTGPVPSTASARQAPRGGRISLTASQFHTEKVSDRLSPPAERVARVPGEERDVGAPELEPLSQEKFTRVKGGDGFFCGTRNSGSVGCWGKEQATMDGKFVDLAIGKAGVCAIDMAGVVSCENETTPQGRFSRLAASGENYCALSRDDQVVCFGSQEMTPPPGFRAQFISVGDRFACAADVTKKLVCWGDTAHLMLPIDPMRVKDIAAGAEFLCVLTPRGDPKCFGKGPRLPEGKYVTVNAGFEEVCAVKMDGDGVCASMNKTFRGPIRRFAIAKGSVCAHLTRNHLDCVGQDAHGQLSPPKVARGKEESVSRAAPSKVTSEDWLNFLGLFPETSSPVSFERSSTISLGDRLPVEVEDLIGADPNRYRTGNRFSFGKDVLGVTLFDLESRELLLFVFAGRVLSDQFTLLRWNQKFEGLTEKADQTASSRKIATARESWLKPNGALEVTEWEGTELASFVKKHQDGSRPVSSLDCRIQKSTWVTTLSAAGKATREKVRVGREYGAVDKDGCAKRFPFR